MAEEKAELDRKAAAEKAEQDRIEAERVAEERRTAAVKAERKRAAAERAAEEAAAIAREKDRAHKSKIMGEAKTALMEHCGVLENDAVKVIRAIVAGNIPHTAVRF